MCTVEKTYKIRQNRLKSSYPVLVFMVLRLSRTPG